MKNLIFTIIGSFILVQLSAQNVGIGETNPQSKLEIKTNSTVTYPQISLIEDEDDFSRLNFTSTSLPDSFWTIAARPATTGSGKMNFYYRSRGDLMTLTTDGNLGIGTSTPTRKLTVKSILGSNIASFDGPNNTFVSILENGRYLGYWGSYSGQPDDIDFGTGSVSTGSLHLATRAQPRLSIDMTGNVGVGTVNPQDKLDVNGNINIEGSLKVNQNAGTEGQVLTSTGNGTPEWRTIDAPNYRISLPFSASPMYSITLYTAVLGATHYNTTPAAISVSGNNITINETGLYHFDIHFMYLNYNPQSNLLYVYLDNILPGSEDIDILNAETISGNTYRNFNVPIEVYITAPRTFNLKIHASGVPSGQLIGTMSGSLRGHIISR